MRIYLIEDFDLKADRIRAFIQSVDAGIEITTLRSYQGGLKAIKAQTPDLIVLDMTLPTFDAAANSRYGRPRSLGGYELMRKMKRKSIFAPVFIISQLEAFGVGKTQTSFAEIRDRCAGEFPGIFRGAAFYSQNSDTWQTALREIVLLIKREDVSC